MNAVAVLKSRLGAESLKKLIALDNASLNEVIAEAILEFQPESVFVSDGSPEDLHRVRVQSIRNGEEKPNQGSGHFHLGDHDTVERAADQRTTQTIGDREKAQANIIKNTTYFFHKTSF